MFYIIGVVSLLSGAFFELIFQMVDNLCISVYARFKKGYTFLMFPSMVASFLKIPLLLLAASYVTLCLIEGYDWMQMFFFYCMIGAGMLLTKELMKEK